MISARTIDGGVNILTLVKGGEQYAFLFDDDNRAEVLKTLGRFASNPELNFSWYDAAVLARLVRDQANTA